MAGRGRTLILKPVIGVMLIFLLLSNVAVTFLPIPDKGSGLERFFLAPVKLIEYRRSNAGNVTRPSLPSLSDLFEEQENSSQRPGYVWFSPEELEKDLNNDVLWRYLDDIISRSIALIEGMGETPTPELVRGTAYMLLLDRVNYVRDSRLDLPSYTVVHGGKCSDWTLVSYALMKRINLIYNITAEYFFVSSRPPCDIGHAFLVAHYPDGHWELYDWFATSYFHISYGESKFKVLRANENTWVIGWFPAGTAKAVPFSSLEEMLSVYSMTGGYLRDGYYVGVYQLPSFELAYQMAPFKASDEAGRKLEEIYAEMERSPTGKFRNSYTVMIKKMGNGNAELVDAGFRDNMILLHIRLMNISSPVELITGERTTAVLVDIGDAGIQKWEGLKYFEGYPAYNYIVLKGDVSEITIGVPYQDPMYYFSLAPWKVTLREYLGGDGVEVLLWEGIG